MVPAVSWYVHIFKEHQLLYLPHTIFMFIYRFGRSIQPNKTKGEVRNLLLFLTLIAALLFSRLKWAIFIMQEVDYKALAPRL